jgi:hypothetical protein
MCHNEACLQSMLRVDGFVTRSGVGLAEQGVGEHQIVDQSNVPVPWYLVCSMGSLTSSSLMELST